MQKIVMKYGGHALEDAGLNSVFCADLKKLIQLGWQCAIVHGGGPHINRMLKRLNIESHFENGLRITDTAVLEVVEMTLCGMVNKAIARLLSRNGIAACGISGEDGGLFRATITEPALGRVGGKVQVNAKLPECLMADDYVPVIAPLALGEDGEPLNVNADTAAAALAASLKAIFILITDVPGVLDENKQLLPKLDQQTVQTLIANGIITGGMLPKVAACMFALENGCPEAMILDGSQPGSLKRLLQKGEHLGTRFTL